MDVEGISGWTGYPCSCTNYWSGATRWTQRGQRCREMFSRAILVEIDHCWSYFTLWYGSVFLTDVSDQSQVVLSSSVHTGCTVTSQEVYFFLNCLEKLHLWFYWFFVNWPLFLISFSYKHFLHHLPWFPTIFGIFLSLWVSSCTAFMWWHSFPLITSDPHSFPQAMACVIVI